MKKTIKVYVQTTPWFISRHRTDWLSRRQMARISERFPEVELFLPQSWMSGLAPNVKYLLGILDRRVMRKIRGPVLMANDQCEPLWKPDIRRIQPDLILASALYPSNAGTIPVFLETFLVDPQAWLFNLTDEDVRAWDGRRKLFSSYGRQSRIIGLRGQYSINLATSLFPELASKVRDLPFYLPDLEAVTEEAVVHKHKEDGVLRILFVGRMAKLKGLPEVIESVSGVAKEFPGRIELQIVSRFDDGEIQIPAAKWIKIEKELSWEQIQERMQRCHVVIMPSHRESYGLVYIEAMAAGCVAAVRDREPQREMVDYGKAGILVDPCKIDAMQESLRELLLDQDLRIRLALNGLRRFIRQYHWAVVGPKWVEAFRDCVAVDRNIAKSEPPYQRVCTHDAGRRNEGL